MKNNYLATYTVDGGKKQDFGEYPVVLAEQWQEKREFHQEFEPSHQNAQVQALTIASELARTFQPNPDTKKCLVTLTTLEYCPQTTVNPYDIVAVGEKLNGGKKHGRLRI